MDGTADKPADLFYDQLMFIHETAAQALEKAEESFNVGIGFLDWDGLNSEQREMIHHWHHGLQKATTAVRNPEL